MMTRLRLERWVTYTSWAVMAAILAWGAVTWHSHLQARTDQAEAQTRHMASLLDDAAETQDQLATLLDEFRAAQEVQERRAAQFRADVDALLEELGVQVERLSGTSSPTVTGPTLVAGPPDRTAAVAGGQPSPAPPADAPAPTVPTAPPTAPPADERPPAEPLPPPGRDPQTAAQPADTSSAGAAGPGRGDGRGRQHAPGQHRGHTPPGRDRGAS